ncbi:MULTISPECIES: site-specific integrase [Sphingobium]|uniref:site-specific integrase n=1 Tax=Sphingobium TaxID=165695 RepID=UPI0024308071|nr:site-specific integrase [Sphingobium yanoikuyae]
MTYLRATTDGGFEVRMTVPKTLQSIIGKSNLTRRLGRVSRSEANRRAASVIVRFQSRIEAARAGQAEEDVAEQLSPKTEPETVSQVRPIDPAPGHKPVSFETIINGYLLERKPAPSTIKRWRPVFAHFKRWVGHDDAARVMPDEVVRWKEELLRSGISGRSVREVYLAALKVVFGWAVENRKVLVNPVTGISVRLAKTAHLRERGFTAIEAKTILLAALAGNNGNVSEAHRSARRWVPFLCAYTGARVGEIAQLRGCDFIHRDGVWAICITPEAGTTKSGSATLVPLHPHLLEQGVVEMARVHGDGPIFFNRSLGRGGDPAHPHHKKVGERLAKWVRELGVDDPQIQPNHAWRHLFKTSARRVGIDPEIRDVLQGHAPRSIGEQYGDWPLETLAAAIDRMPRIEV